MKKMHRNHRFQWIVKALAFIVWLALAGATAQAQGQTLQNGAAQPAADWVAPNTAIDLLEDNIETVHSQLPGLVANTQPHDNALRRVAYYKGLIRELKAGKNVPTALENALPDAATLSGAKEQSFTSKIVLRALYDETRILLTL